LLTVDDETASLARALYAKAGPDPRTLEPRQLAYEIARLLLELEDDQLRARSDYNEAAQAEAERDGDTATIDRLLLERRQINEARRSLDRRRDATRLLARPETAVRVCTDRRRQPCPPIPWTSNSWKRSSRDRAAPRPTSKRPSWPACARRAAGLPSPWRMMMTTTTTPIST
jgi:hypothetical protein